MTRDLGGQPGCAIWWGATCTCLLLCVLGSRSVRVVLLSVARAGPRMRRVELIWPREKIFRQLRILLGREGNLRSDWLALTLALSAHSLICKAVESFLGHLFSIP